MRSPTSARPFWKRANGAKAGFSIGLGAGTTPYGGLANQIEGGISQAEMDDVEFAMELQNRHDKDLDSVKLAADLTPADEK